MKVFYRGIQAQRVEGQFGKIKQNVGKNVL